MKSKVTISLISLALPAVSLAAGATAQTLISKAIGILSSLIPFAIGLAVVVFLFAMVKYVISGSGEEKAAARGLMIYGIIAIFVMVSIWGLVKFIQDSTGIDQGSAPQAPTIPGVNNNSGSGDSGTLGV